MDLLKKTGFLAAKPADTPPEQRHNLEIDQGDLIENPSSFRQLVGSLRYLTVTRPDISYAIISQPFMQEPRKWMLRIAFFRI